MERGKRDKSRSDAWAICDRTGVRFPMREMVIEPGTGYLVHKKASDGPWNYVQHPQANLLENGLTFGDPFPVMEARPNQPTATTSEYLQDIDGSTFVDDNGVLIELRNANV